MPDKKKCFVVMGFGEKTDLATGRTLDLDKTYRIIIRKAVEEAGLECIRADDIKHSGLIDVPMYELLLEADIVIADLSTANPNAIYELGVRHALRPHTTIIMAESQFKFPFDLSHIVIRPYEHLGKGIDAEHAEKVRDELKAAIHKLLDEPDVDSPVYRFLPKLRAWNAGVAPILEAAVAEAAQPAAAAAAVAGDTSSIAELMEMFREAKQESEWSSAARSLKKLIEKRPNEPYFQQQLALATYKSKKPDPVAALNAAKEILQKLDPHTSTDPETLGLWGAVHKRLYELTGDTAALDESIWAYQKGFYVKNDHYNGINLAFVLNLRAANAADPQEATADAVQARRVRRKVAEIARKLLAAGIKDDDGKVDAEETFWVQASLVEALEGSGQKDEAAKLREELANSAPAPWMVETMNDQLGKLDGLLAKVQ
ncbi:MAG TPA: TRAFs-binding domain-containing protein [Thermoanaerobaculia bacterium]|nr:TRAFs-binding domain-containing protein [Thermoanaerobaculia bacterium]